MPLRSPDSLKDVGGGALAYATGGGATILFLLAFELVDVGAKAVAGVAVVRFELL